MTPRTEVMVVVSCPDCDNGTVVRSHGSDPRSATGARLGTYRAICPRCKGDGRLVPAADLERALDALEEAVDDLLAWGVCGDGKTAAQKHTMAMVDRHAALLRAAGRLDG